MAFSRTPFADRIAAGMSAAGGDRLYAPGAAYRRGGFDERRWIRETNRALRETHTGYEVGHRGALDGSPMLMQFCRVVDNRVTVLTKAIQPEHTSVQALIAMIDVYERGCRSGAHAELVRQHEAAMAQRQTPQPVRRRTRPRVEEPEEAAAPGMRP